MTMTLSKRLSSYSVMHELYKKKKKKFYKFGSRNKELFRIDRGQKRLNTY